MTTDTPTPVEARLRPTVAMQPGSELDIRYDGSTPPTDLFLGLTAIGWQHAVASPPPAKAIDWSTPDQERGTRHTVLPFAAVTTATLDGSERFREVALEQTRQLLTRHGLLDGPPASPTTGAGPTATDEPTCTVAITVDAASADRLRMLAERHGRILGDEGDVHVQDIRFRGSSTTPAEVLVRRVTVEVPTSQRSDLVASLVGLPVRGIKDHPGALTPPEAPRRRRW